MIKTRKYQYLPQSPCPWIQAEQPSSHACYHQVVQAWQPEQHPSLSEALPGSFWDFSSLIDPQIGPQLKLNILVNKLGRKAILDSGFIHQIFPWNIEAHIIHQQFYNFLVKIKPSISFPHPFTLNQLWNRLFLLLLFTLLLILLTHLLTFFSGGQFFHSFL